MKARILMSMSAVLTATVAFAAQSVFSVFPKAGGDLASATDWGDVPKPTASDHLKIDKGGTYTLGDDLSIASVSLTTTPIVFDFTNGNHTLTLNTMCSGWGNVQSLFQFSHDDNRPAVTLKGGTWKSASANNNFWIVALGNSDNSHFHTFMATNGCVITNVNGFYTSRRMSNTRNTICDGSRVYAKTASLFEVDGTNNVLDIASGGSLTLSTAFYGDTTHADGAWASKLLDDMTDVHGAGSMLKVTGSDGAFVGRYSSGMGMRVRDGGTLDTPSLFIGRCASTSVSSSNWMEVRDGGSLNTGTVQFYGPRNHLLVSNATVVVTNINDTTFTMGAGGVNAWSNTTVVSGAGTVFNVKPGATGDVFGRYGHHNTFVLENGAVWAPKKNMMFCWGSNNVLRITGAGTMFDSSTNATDNTFYTVGIGPSDRNYDSWCSNTWNNVLEILDGAEFRVNRFFVHGFNNTIVVSNATLTAGSYPLNGSGAGYAVWLGRQASSNVTLVIKGTTPKVRSLYSGSLMKPLMLQNASCLRYEIPQQGYAAGYAPIELAYLYPTSANVGSCILQIECAEWAAHGPRNSREIVLFRGVLALSSTTEGVDVAAWLASQNLNLPANVTCFIRDKELVLKRRVSGFEINMR